MKNRNYLPDDFLTLFENRVRSVGVWCDTSARDKLRHKFLARNPNSMLAISLCGEKIVRIEKLHENVISQKCLVCELYDTDRREVNDRTIETLSQNLEESKLPQIQNKE